MKSHILKKAITKSAQIVGAGALLALCAGVAQANLLTNGTFEAGAPGGGYCATGWTCFANVFNENTTTDPFAPVSHDVPGVMSIKMFGPFVPGDASGMYQAIPVTAGTAHEVTAHAMNWIGDPFNNLGILQVSFWDAAGGQLGGGNQIGVVETFVDTIDDGVNTYLPIEDGAEVSDWTEISVTAIAPAGTQSMEVFLLHIQLGDTPFGGSLFWDDVCTGSLEDCYTEPPPPIIPIPAAVWLFGSGLLGLVGMARRKKA